MAVSCQIQLTNRGCSIPSFHTSVSWERTSFFFYPSNQFKPHRVTKSAPQGRDETFCVSPKGGQILAPLFSTAFNIMLPINKIHLQKLTRIPSFPQSMFLFILQHNLFSVFTALPNMVEPKHTPTWFPCLKVFTSDLCQHSA